MVEHNQSQYYGNQYKFNGKELDAATGMYYYGARYYDPRLSIFISVDPLAEKYHGYSPYCYVMNNPVNAIDPDGKRVYFIAGAGNDSDGWNYVGRFKSLWSKSGIKDFRRVNASGGKMEDIGFVNNFRNRQSFWTDSSVRGPKQHFAKDNKQFQKALKGILKDLKNNPLKDGDQLNLAGYSYGSVMQAHLAIALADEGHKVDNLILIGSPISDNSDLMKTLQGYQESGKIGNIIREDIKGDYLSNPDSEFDFIRGGIQNSPLGDGNDGAHFDLARPGESVDKKIEQLGKDLIQNGVE